MFPSFPRAFTWTVDETIATVDLPVATGGDGTLSYESLPAELPPGITREGPDRRR